MSYITVHLDNGRELEFDDNPYAVKNMNYTLKYQAPMYYGSGCFGKDYATCTCGGHHPFVWNRESGCYMASCARFEVIKPYAY